MVTSLSSIPSDIKNLVRNPNKKESNQLEAEEIFDDFDFHKGPQQAGEITSNRQNSKLDNNFGNINSINIIL